MPWKSYHTVELTESYLFKFLPRKWLFEFLKSGNIWFSRADKFGDKMECVRISDLQVEHPNFKDIEERKRRFLISCWHLANKESLAFWDTYSDELQNRKNFAVRFKRKDMLNYFNGYFHRNDNFYIKTKFIHGKVIYKNLVTANIDTLNKSKVKYPAFRKESAFKYENEYRFVIEQVNNHIESGLNFYIGDPTRLSFDIIVNPLLKKEIFNSLTEEVKKTGFKDKIKPSVLTKWLRPEEW